MTKIWIFLKTREIFSVEDKTKLVKAIGIDIAVRPEDLHIYVNGKDILKHFVLDTFLITSSVKAPVAPQPPDQPQVSGYGKSMG